MVCLYDTGLCASRRYDAIPGPWISESVGLRMRNIRAGHVTVMCWSHAHNDLKHKTLSQCLNRIAAVNGLSKNWEEHESCDSHVMTLKRERVVGVVSHIGETLSSHRPLLMFLQSRNKWPSDYAAGMCTHLDKQTYMHTHIHTHTSGNQWSLPDQSL